MTSDLFIPRTTDLIARALDIRDSAVRLGDTATIAQVDRLVQKLPGARLCWQLGTLIVTSPSGHTYHVTNAGCDCENARKCSKRQCWHLLCRGVLEDLFATACDTADMDATPPVDIPDESPPTEGGDGPPTWPAPNGGQPWYARMATARRLAWATI